jgi:hypothetical protein
LPGTVTVEQLGRLVAPQDDPELAATLGPGDDVVEIAVDELQLGSVQAQRPRRAE